MGKNLLGNLGPVRRPAQPARLQGCFDDVGAVFTLQECEQRRRIEHAHAALSEASSSAAFGQQFTDEIEPGKIGTDKRSQLLSGQENQTPWRFNQCQSLAFDQPGTLAQLGRYNQSSTVPHRNGVCPTHC